MEQRIARRTGVVAVLVENGRLLIIRRSDRVEAPRTYCFPGGAIENGETETEALRREIREELGGEVEPLARLWENVTDRNIRLIWWHCRWIGPAAPQPNPAEVESLHWLTAEEIRVLRDSLSSNGEFLDAWARGTFSLDGAVPPGENSPRPTSM